MNPENINGVGQSVAEPNPNQNMTNQNMAFPGQGLQPVQDQFAQTPPLQTPPAKSKKPILIACIVGALVLIMAIVGVVCVMAMQSEDDNNPPAGGIVGEVGDIADEPAEDAAEEVGSDVVEDVVLDVNDVVDVEKFTQMTKAEVVAFLKAGRNTAGTMPKNYVDKEIMDLVIVKNSILGSTVKSDVLLKYSHETTDDLQQIANEWWGFLGRNDGITEDDYEIREYDYYAIVVPKRMEVDTCDKEYYGDCSSLLSFKRDYINHYQEETTPNSYNDVVYFNTLDPETVKHLMRVWSLFYNYGAASGHGNIYGSNFEEQDDKFVLTVYYVGIGLDMENLKFDSSGINYAINLYSRQYAADKVDGRLHVIRTGEDRAIENIKSIPITEKEAASLMSR